MSSQDSVLTKKKLKYRILSPHIAGCPALAATKRVVWGTPWAYLDKVEYRDSVGRLRKNVSGRRWWRVICNHIRCKAEIAVCETSILENLPHE